MSRADDAIAWQAQSLLLSYPDDDLIEYARLVRQALPELPVRVATPLRRFLDHVDTTPLLDLAIDYVATFDNKKRCSLFLTYYAHGDTRNRGVALLRLKQTYRRAGFTLVEHELPDHLAVMLEFAAARAHLRDAPAVSTSRRRGTPAARPARRTLTVGRGARVGIGHAARALRRRSNRSRSPRRRRPA